ncbi:CoA transferase [Rhodococcus opacus]|uniref:CoA transferase n=1 Tax=Rhodococcus opacus TaxID=37919 RepID=A0A2S8IVI7_RHOOP|nr:CoA transferase [Rhodococcus opacus]PQP18392.1 hypothetical protein C5613_32360 [Rhodococcus opacus]
MRAGARHATIAPYGPFTCNDGITLNLGLQNEREWARFCSIVLEKPISASDPRFGSNHQRVAHRRELDTIISEVLGSLDSAQVRKLFDEAAIAFAEQRTVRAFADHPQLAASERWEGVATPEGVVRTLIPAPSQVIGTEDAFRALESSPVRR